MNSFVSSPLVNITMSQHLQALNIKCMPLTQTSINYCFDGSDGTCYKLDDMSLVYNKTTVPSTCTTSNTKYICNCKGMFFVKKIDFKSIPFFLKYVSL